MPISARHATPPVQRYLSVWLPLMATDRIMRQRHGPSWRSPAARTPQPRSDRPLVISRPERSTQRIAFVNAQASRLGLKPGMGIADARAMHPGIDVLEEDADADRAAPRGAG